MEASAEEGDDLLGHVVGGHFLTRDLVDPVQQHVHELVGADTLARARLSAADYGVTHRAQRPRVGGPLFLGSAEEHGVEEGRQVRSPPAIDERRGQAVDERVQILRVELIEAHVEGAQADCVESQTREGVYALDIDLRALSVPQQD